MPELPEVETVANSMHRRAAGARIEHVWFSNMPQTMRSTAAEMEPVLEGATIERVRRVGKHIVFDLLRGKKRSDAQWIVHLGMTGRLLVTKPEAEIEKHTHAILKLRDGNEIRFVDPRRFGKLSVHRSEGGFTGPGVEPTTITAKDFAKLFKGRRTPVKSALLNQKLLHGVGNIYADEALNRAGIRPTRSTARITQAEWKKLHGALLKVLKEAIKLGGSSVSDYVNADGEEGTFQIRHRVYMRTGLPCFKCKAPIARRVIAGRSSHYCPQCQH